MYSLRFDNRKIKKIHFTQINIKKTEKKELISSVQMNLCTFAA